ncbi:unnamed protein product, partial [Amoebophrya sp. A25]
AEAAAIAGDAEASSAENDSEKNIDETKMSLNLLEKMLFCAFGQRHVYDFTSSTLGKWAASFAHWYYSSPIDCTSTTRSMSIGTKTSTKSTSHSQSSSFQMRQQVEPRYSSTPPIPSPSIVSYVVDAEPGVESQVESFLCDDNTRILKTRAVNDDFCDCDDGTDEWETGACAGVNVQDRLEPIEAHASDPDLLHRMRKRQWLMRRLFGDRLAFGGPRQVQVPDQEVAPIAKENYRS